jgi:hypothetical protein
VTYQSGGLTAGPFKHGSSGGGANYTNFVLQPGETLQWLELWLHNFSGTDELNGLTLHGTQHSGVVGKAEGSKSILKPDGNIEIACFGGRQGTFVNALGFYYRRLGTPK